MERLIMNNWNLKKIIEKLGERLKKQQSINSITGFNDSEEVRQLDEFVKNNFSNFDSGTSAGVGTLAQIPWIRISDPNLSSSAKNGIYIDYLYTSKLQRVFLCLALGTSQFKDIKAGERQSIVGSVVGSVKKYFGFNLDAPKISLVDGNPNKASNQKYEDTVIYSIEYNLSDLPSNKEMMDDLNYFVSLLEKITKEKLDEIFRNNSNIISEKDESYNVEITNPQIDLNTIYYGVPGTGKSYQVKRLIEDNNITDEDVFRSTLHPEYSYSDFVGQVLPDAIDDNPTYKYQKGIFTKALERALKVDEPVLLILEEMSRANVAAVFGDIFQLLDRDQAGKSDYGIDNDLIYNHLDEEVQNALKGKKIILPENLYIIGTVNTSDQNVFPMDNAFKRRFSWKYVSIKTPDDENNPELTIKVGKGNQVTEYPVKWSELLFKLNEFIVNRDKGLGLTEDKQLGPYFIKFNDTNDIKTNDELIKNKLLQYLWDDVQNSMAAFGNANITLFDKSIHSFSELYECYDKQQIFSNEFLGKDLLNQEADNHEE